MTQRPKGTADKHLSSGALRGWGVELEGHCLSVGRLSLEEGQSLEDLRMLKGLALPNLGLSLHLGMQVRLGGTEEGAQDGLICPNQTQISPRPEQRYL